MINGIKNFNNDFMDISTVIIKTFYSAHYLDFGKYLNCNNLKIWMFIVKWGINLPLSNFNIKPTNDWD